MSIELSSHRLCSNRAQANLGAGPRRPCTTRLRASVRASVREQPVDESLTRSEEALHELDGLGVVVADLLDATLAAAVDGRLRIGEHYRRVGSDNELRALLDQLVDAPQERQAVLRRQCGLGLIEDVEAVRTEPVQENREERLAVRLLVER